METKGKDKDREGEGRRRAWSHEDAPGTAGRGFWWSPEEHHP